MARFIVVLKSDKFKHGIMKSSFPFVHSELESAIKEAVRLSEKTGNTFCVFAEAVAIAPPPKPTTTDGTPLEDVLADGIAKVMKKAKVK